MVSNSTGVSAFDQGQIAGKKGDSAMASNPFVEGSAEHNNFEVGRRFAAAHFDSRRQPAAAAMKPDFDEGDS